MNEIVIIPKDYEIKLRIILQKYHIPACNLFFVPKLPFLINRKSPFIPAQCHKDKKAIYILDALDQFNIDAALQTLPLDEVGKYRKNILQNDSGFYLMHVLLHEVGHILHPKWNDEAKVDEWAFKEMGL